MTADQVVVSCTNAGCSDPARITSVSKTLVAPGIVALPNLLCAACGCELYEHHEPIDEERRDQLGRPAVLPGAIRDQVREAIRRELIAWGYADMPIESLVTDLTGAIFRLDAMRSALGDQRRLQP